MPVKPVPDGYHTVTPYLVVKNVPRLIEFLKRAFSATVTECMDTPDGTVMHAQLKIGDSIVMMGEARDPWPAMPTNLYLYLPECDEVYRRARDAGGESLREPTDEFYGDRVAGVKDPVGNSWWIATHTEDVPPEEMRRRAEQAAKERKGG